MAIPSSSSQAENFSKHRAPFFMGTDYPYWKTRMTWYLQSTDLDVWDVIENDPTFPTKLVDEVLVPKPKQEWNELDRRNFQLNVKAIFTLQCAMDRNEYNRICQCKSAKEIWRLLEITHERTNQVKGSKINLLVHNYELFSMKETETIVEMITSFRKNLQGIQEGNEDIEVSPIKVAYQGHRNSRSKRRLTKLPMEELIGSLMTYEINLTKKLQEGEDKKKKSITLKATTKEEEDVEEEKPSDEDDDLALITRKLNKYMRGEMFRGRKFTSKRDPSKMESSSHGDKEKWEEKRELTCFNESEESSEEENDKEVANMCFMAIDDLDEGSMKDKWFLDSGCSRHMTGDESKFAFLTKRNGGYVTFGDNSKGRIIGQDSIGNGTSSLIESVLLVDGLKHNLLSISQLCDKGFKHRRLGHANMDLISQLNKDELVRGLPKINFQKDKVCEACQMGKQIKNSFKNKNFISTTRPLELLHMDLFGPSRTPSLGGKSYAFVIVDEFSRYTWVLFLSQKNEAFYEFSKFCNKVQNEKGFTITCIRSDHGREFENIDFEDYCNEHGINHNFSAPRTPQQNGVVERKNRTLQEMAKTMLNENNLPKYFWAEAVNTSCYVLNIILLRPILKKTPYELWKNKKPNISYFKVFGCKCFILNTKDNLGKFDAKSNVGIFLGYSTSSKAFRVFNKRTMVVDESIHVIFYESNNSLQEIESFDDDLGLETSMGKLKIEDRRHQEKVVEDPKKEESPLALPPPQQV
uniref:Uncharacterized protein n=1 Tax=Vitis vinifera TaxID=29760 RepID=A5BMX7_VITVI|nr:hypothetical protein VITISV_003263 [Vitis vinifera]